MLIPFRKIQEAESRMREAEERAREAEGRARETERRAREAERRAREAEQEKEVAQREKARAEASQQESEQRLAESEGKLSQLETQWVLDPREIQLTQQELGRGGWATVRVAVFRGASVAAKCIHGEIVSEYNIQLFKREMNLAARIRHPNLLQFIGATLEGEMMILTELMPTSLRNVLKRQAMSPYHATGVSLDVARALNYLHLMRPHPLIHRDISSANVLLGPLPRGRWRAKVSDYGSVNLQEKLHTANPGNPCYSAPEAGDPSQQSPKMDMFSFGVLLLEMLTGRFPDTEERADHLRAVQHQPLLALIQRCLEVRKEDRPKASDIITELRRPLVVAVSNC